MSLSKDEFVATHVCPNRNHQEAGGVYSRVRTLIRGVILILPLSAISCRPGLDLAAALRVESVATGWYAASSAAPGQIKLVPAATFQLKNVSNQPLTTLQVNAIFKRVTEDTEWGSDFRTVAGSSGLLPLTTSDKVSVVSPLGYTGTESRFEMLQNSHFVDAHVAIFAKYGSATWARIGAYRIARQLIEP
jgi:hypothetical protein